MGRLLVGLFFFFFFFNSTSEVNCFCLHLADVDQNTKHEKLLKKKKKKKNTNFKMVFFFGSRSSIS